MSGTAEHSRAATSRSPTGGSIRSANGRSRMSRNWCRPPRSRRRAPPRTRLREPGLIASLSITLAGGESRTALEHFKQSYADRFVMMRDGVVLDEWLAPHAEAERPHIIYSISKSVTGMLAGIAVGDGKLDPDAERQRLRQGQARQRLSRGARARPARHDGEPRFRGELSRHERRFRPLSPRDAVESRAQRRQAGNHARGAGIAEAARPSARHDLLLRLAQHRHARAGHRGGGRPALPHLPRRPAVGADGRARRCPCHRRTGGRGARGRRHLRDARATSRVSASWCSTAA